MLYLQVNLHTINRHEKKSTVISLYYNGCIAYFLFGQQVYSGGTLLVGRGTHRIGYQGSATLHVQ